MKAYQAKDRINIPHLLIHACQSKGKQSQYTLLPKSIVGKLLNTKKKRSFDDILEESFNGIIKKITAKDKLPLLVQRYRQCNSKMKRMIL